MNETHRQLVEFYIKAKDQHQPHLIKRAFAENATVKIDVNTDAISFPPEINGRENITDALVSQFHKNFENVYTFCIEDNTVESDGKFQCKWLVGMTEIESGSLKLGYGDYYWQFDEHETDNVLQVLQLTISIEDMITRPPEAASSVLAWLDSLPHPWVFFQDLALSPPDIPMILNLLNLSPQKRGPRK